MKVIFNQKDLLSALEAVEKFVPVKAVKPIYQFVKIQAVADNDRVNFYVIDGVAKCGIRKTLIDQGFGDSPATIEQNGVAVILASELKEVVKSLRKPQLTLEVQGTTATVSAGKSVFKLNGLEPLEFPDQLLLTKEDATTVEITAVKLRQLVDRVAYAAIKDPGTPRTNLLGVNLVVGDGKVKAAASDSHRLAMFETVIQSQVGENCAALVPSLLLEKLGALVPKDDDEVVSLEFGQSSIIATWDDDGTRVVIPLLEAVFPDLSRVVPSQFKAEITMNREEWQSLVKRGQLIAKDSENVNILVSFYESRVEATAKSAERGAFEDEIEARTTGIEEGQVMYVSFNTRYMLEALKPLQDEGKQIITIRYTGAQTAFTVSGEGDDQAAVSLLLPVRVSAPEKEGVSA